MNKELQDRLLEYLGSLEGAVRQAGGFVAEQAPMVAQEWVEYEFWSNLIPCIGLLVVVIVLAWAGAVFVRKQFHDTNNPWILGGIACLVFACFAIGTGSSCGMRALKAQIAPRVVVLEKLVSLTEQIRP